MKFDVKIYMQNGKVDCFLFSSFPDVFQNGTRIRFSGGNGDTLSISYDLDEFEKIEITFKGDGYSENT